MQLWRAAYWREAVGLRPRGVWALSALGPTRRRDCFRELLLALHGVPLGLLYTLHLSTLGRSAPTVPYLATPAQSSFLTPRRSFS